MIYISNIQLLFLEASFLELYWQNNTPIAKILILFILTLLLISVRMFFQNRARIGLEFFCLDKLKENLANWKEHTPLEEIINEEEYVESTQRVDGDFEEDIITMYEASIEDDLMPGINRNTMVFERLKALQELRKTKSRVNVGVLQNLIEIQDSRYISSRLPSYIMTLAMLLGMLGTFIGLTILVSEITSQLNLDVIDKNDVNSQIKTSFEKINNSLKGVGTAFTTTLMGLLCTIIVSALNFLQNQQKAKFFDLFEQFTVKELLPYTFPDMEQEEVINAIKDQLRETFDKLNRTIDKNRKTLGTIDGLYQKFDTVVDTVKEVMSAGSTAELHTVLQEMQGVNSNLNQIIDKYENRKLLGDFQKVAEKYEGYLNKHDFILEQSKWLPNARAFMFAIAALLGIIAIALIIPFFL